MAGSTACFVAFVAITVVASASDQMSLLIQPNNNGTLTKEIGGSLAITCKPNVPDPSQITQLEWKDYRGNKIDIRTPNPSLYVNKFPEGIVLVFSKLTQEQGGLYTCSANYAASEKLQASVTVRPIVDITFTDAPEHQYPILGQNYTVKCVVVGSPQPYVDWFRSGQSITTTDRYVITNQGLLIKNVRESDDGTYTCSAFVFDTGNIKSRVIKVEVQIRPKIEPMEEVKIIEGDTATVKCIAIGKPPPSYRWIKESTKQDLSRTDRFDVRATTGILTINRVEYNDNGYYTCEANNSAGFAEESVFINVLVKPRIYELLNATVELTKEANLTCKAYGRPPPDVVFRKRSNREPFQIGNNEGRISLTQSKDEKKGETFTTMIIYGVNRSDDGLYECVASNEAGEAYKNGHIAVEFPPTFERTKDYPPVYSWNGKPGNLTCLPEAIPNATITWRYGREEITNTNVFRIEGVGVRSSLIVNPGNERRYFTKYECVARNKLGEDRMFIELRQGLVPERIQQVLREYETATTVKFKIVPPANLRGLPLRSITVQYKDEKELSWENARNITWSVDAPYIVENLIPERTYNFRFAARNDVGLGPWYGDLSVTMPRRSVPAEPKIFLPNYSSDPYKNYGEATNSPYADHFELRWNVPNDNGDPIDSYTIRYCVSRKIDGRFRVDETTCSGEIMTSFAQNSYDLYNLEPDTVYKIELRAHNAIGLSSPAEIYVKTARGMDPPVPPQPSMISSGAIIGIVVAAIFVVLIVVDLICFCVARDGILARICDRSKSKKQEDDPKLGREEKEPLQSDYRAHQNGDRSATTYVEYDRGQVYSRSGEIIGKHSAV